MNNNSNIGVVYALKNLYTGQLYVGSAVNFVVRKRNHLSLLRRNKHHNPILQNSYNKYGLDAFEFSILENNLSHTLLLSREQHWIDALQPSFNILKVAGTHLGAKRSEEVKKKISKALTGKKLSEEHKEKVRQANVGKKYSEEVKRKKSESLKRYYKLVGKAAKQLCALEKSRALQKKAVAKIDKITKEVLESFDSFEEAARNVGLTSGECISRVANGKTKIAAGYEWRLL